MHMTIEWVPRLRDISKQGPRDIYKYKYKVYYPCVLPNYVKSITTELRVDVEMVAQMSGVENKFRIVLARGASARSPLHWERVATPTYGE